MCAHPHPNLETAASVRLPMREAIRFQKIKYTKERADWMKKKIFLIGYLLTSMRKLEQNNSHRFSILEKCIKKLFTDRENGELDK